MRRILIVVACFIVAGIACSPLAASDRFSGTAAARVEFDKANSALEAQEWDKAAAGFKRAAELDPNFSEAHLQYIHARTLAAMGDIQTLLKRLSDSTTKEELEQRVKAVQKEMTQEYQNLARQHPEMPIYRWALAQMYSESDPALQEQYCKQTVESDPAFTLGYRCLAQVAQVRGDTKAAVYYFRKVIELTPDDPTLLAQLPRMVREDPEEFKTATMEVVNKLPNSEQAVSVLSDYADSLNGAARKAALEEIVAKFLPQKFRAASQAADALFQLYDSDDPAKGATLAHRVLSAMPNDRSWKSKVAYSDAMAEAERKIKAGDGKTAMAVLKDIKTPSYTFDKSRLQLLQATAQALTGDDADAYAGLLKTFSSRPMPKVQPALYEYGEKLGKSRSVVDEEVWNLRSANARPAIPFSLESFTDGKKLSLEDFKDHVVLLDFWYPNCGPCRRSLPYLQALWTKYKASGLVFLGINGFEEQESLVLPLVKSRGWGFTPLKSTKSWASDVYKVNTYPSTFLIGADGRVYFEPHVHDEDEQAGAEMEIEALLAAAQQNKGTKQR